MYFEFDNDGMESSKRRSILYRFYCPRTVLAQRPKPEEAP